MQQYMLLQRNLVYTGITRGNKLVVLIGQRKALAMGGEEQQNTEPVFRAAGEVDDMKAELLDIVAILSIAVAKLSQPNPGIKRALALVDEARDKVLYLAKGLDESPKN